MVAAAKPGGGAGSKIPKSHQSHPLPHSMQVMVAKHSCTAAEVQHVLFCLEKMDRIMCEDGMIYPCY